MTQEPTGAGDFAGGLSQAEIAGMPRQSQLDFDIAFFEALAERAPVYVDVLRCLGGLLARKKSFRRALAIDRRLSQLLPADPTVLYNLACSLALSGFKTDALAALTRAVDCGYGDWEHLEADPDLECLRSEPAYRRLLKELGPV